MKTPVVMIMFFFFVSLSANLVTNQPYEHTQPDGTKLSLFVSGDEFYHRVHDAGNYTILLHPETGYAVYAVPDGKGIKASEFVAGVTDPKVLGIKPGHTKDLTEAKARAAETQARRDGGSRSPTIGTIYNVVGFVRFADQTEYPPTPTFVNYHQKFMSVYEQSLSGYLDEVSNGQLDFNSYLYPGEGTEGYPLSFQVSHTRGYYSPYNSVTNPDGYTDDMWFRLTGLLSELCGLIGNYIPPTVNVDIDNDLQFDALTFILRGDRDAHGDILWPTTWTIPIIIAPNLAGKSVTHWVFQVEEGLNPAVLCHETGHMIGFPDLYHYTDNNISPAGFWDLMDQDNAQHFLTHMKWRYGHWFTTIPTITPTGTPTQYTLTAIDVNPYACYKIQSNYPGHYYMLEYRRKTGLYETGVPGSGLIVYRIQEGLTGNAPGPPDEVYVYRPGGSYYSNGEPNEANLSSTVGRTAIHNYTDPEPWIEINNTNQEGNLVITDVGPNDGSTITFTVRNFPPNIWEGIASTDWAEPYNWSLNHVPNATEYVEIPGGAPRYPVIDEGILCMYLTVKTGASLTINNGNLYIAQNFDNYGTLIMNHTDANLYVFGDLYFCSGSSANIPVNAQIWIKADLEFRSGSNVHMANGTIHLYQDHTSYIKTNAPTDVYNISVAKPSTTYICGFSSSSTHPLTINGYLSVNSTSKLIHNYTGTTILMSDIIVNSGGICTFDNGTLNMSGSGNVTIYGIHGGNYLNKLTVNKDDGYYINLSSHLVVKSDLTFNSGIMNASNYTITLGGHWIHADNPILYFMPGTGTVILNGTADQNISSVYIYNLTLNKSSGNMVIPTGSTVVCSSFDWTAGSYLVSGGTFVVSDLADPGIYGTIYLTDGLIDFTQDSGQRMDLRGNLTISGGTFNVSGGSDNTYFSYGSDIASLTMSGGILDFKTRGFTISADLAFNENITDGTIRIAKDLYNYRTDFNISGGTVELYGNQNCSLLTADGSNLCNLIINKTPATTTIASSGVLDINGNFTLQSGTYAAPLTIKLAGNWNRNTGAVFNPGSGRVIIDGTTHQYINTETFNILELAKTSGLLLIDPSFSVVCASYDWTSGAMFVSGSFTANDLADSGIYGNIDIDGGHVSFTQDSGSPIDLNCAISIISDGIFDVYGGNGNCLISNGGNAVLNMDSGSFNVRDHGILIWNTAYTCEFYIYGGTIRCNGDWIDYRGNFHPTGGVLEMTGPTENLCYPHPDSWLHTLVVNKETSTNPDHSRNLFLTTMTVKGGITMQLANLLCLGGTLSCANGGDILINDGELQLNGFTLISTGNITVYGGLLLTDDSMLKISNSKSLVVGNGGYLIAIGRDTNPVTITRNGTGYYGLSIQSGGSIKAVYAIFEYMNAVGVSVLNGAEVEAPCLNHCTFRNGAAGGRLLAINNSQYMNVIGAVFPANTWSGTYNVAKLADQGYVYFTDYSGAFSGPAYERDNYNRIGWEGSAFPPPFNVTANYIQATNRIQLSWDYPWGTVDRFKIYRSSTPDGTYSSVGVSTITSWSEVVPGDKYFYKVKAEILTRD